MFILALDFQRFVFHCVHFQPLFVACCDSIALQMPPSSANLISPFPSPSIYIIPQLVSNLVSALPSNCSASPSFFYRETGLVSVPSDISCKRSAVPTISPISISHPVSVLQLINEEIGPEMKSRISDMDISLVKIWDQSQASRRSPCLSRASASSRQSHLLRSEHWIVKS